MKAPDGFEFIRWEDVVDGQTVWLWGQHRVRQDPPTIKGEHGLECSQCGVLVEYGHADGCIKLETMEPHAYGPHHVHDKRGRQLINQYGVTFRHYAEELVVKRIVFHHEVGENADIYP